MEDRIKFEKFKDFAPRLNDILIDKIKNLEIRIECPKCKKALKGGAHTIGYWMDYSDPMCDNKECKTEVHLDWTKIREIKRKIEQF